MICEVRLVMLEEGNEKYEVERKGRGEKSEDLKTVFTIYEFITIKFFFALSFGSD